MVFLSAVTMQEATKRRGKENKRQSLAVKLGGEEGFEKRLSEEMIFARVIGNGVSWSVICE